MDINNSNNNSNNNKCASIETSQAFGFRSSGRDALQQQGFVSQLQCNIVWLEAGRQTDRWTEVGS